MHKYPQLIKATLRLRWFIGCCLLFLALMLVLMGIPSVRVQAAEGDLDTTFGSGGKVTTVFSSEGDIANGVAIQNDGKIIVVGQASNPDFFGVLARYNNLVFDLCLQDESNGNILSLNTTTGEYQFTNCGGLTIGGIGTVTRRGGLITFQHSAPDRRITASIDTATSKTNASVQLFAQGRTFTVTDKNITNNTCACLGR